MGAAGVSPGIYSSARKEEVIVVADVVVSQVSGVSQASKMKVSGADLGITDVQFTRPSPNQLNRFPNVRANMRFSFILKSQSTIGGIAIPTKIAIRGARIVAQGGDDDALAVQLPFIPGTAQGQRPFFFMNRLDPVREKYLIALYKKTKDEWANQPEVPEFPEVEVYLPEASPTLGDALKHLDFTDAQ